jgi:hypothetical protein
VRGNVRIWGVKFFAIMVATVGGQFR